MQSLTFMPFCSAQRETSVYFILKIKIFNRKIGLVCKSTRRASEITQRGVVKSQIVPTYGAEKALKRSPRFTVLNYSSNYQKFILTSSPFSKINIRYYRDIEKNNNDVTNAKNIVITTYQLINENIYLTR